MLQMNAFLEDLKYIVGINNIVGNKAGIVELSNYVKDKIAGFDNLYIEEHESPEYGPSLFITNCKQYKTDKLDVLLISHFDTLHELEDEAQLQYKQYSNYITGLGVLSDKSNLLLSIYLLLALKDINIKIGVYIHQDHGVGCEWSANKITQFASHAKCCISLRAVDDPLHVIDKGYGKVTYNINWQHHNNNNDESAINASTLIESSKFIKYIDNFNNGYKSFLNFIILENTDNDIDVNSTYTEILLQMRYTEHAVLYSLEDKLANYVNNYCHKNIAMNHKQLYLFPPMQAHSSQSAFKRIVNNAFAKYNLEAKWISLFENSSASFASLADECVVIDGMGNVGKFIDNQNILVEHLDINFIETRYNILTSTILASLDQHSFTKRTSNARSNVNNDEKILSRSASSTRSGTSQVRNKYNNNNLNRRS